MRHGAVYDSAHNSPEVEAVAVAASDFVKARNVVESVKSEKVSQSNRTSRIIKALFSQRADTTRRFSDLITGVISSSSKHRFKFV